MRKAIWSRATSVANGFRLHLCTLLFFVLKGTLTIFDTIYSLLSTSQGWLKSLAGFPKPQSFSRRLHRLLIAGRRVGHDSEIGGWIVSTSGGGPWVSRLSTWAYRSVEFMSDGGRRLLTSLGDRAQDVEADAGRQADALGRKEHKQEHTMRLPTYSSIDLGLSQTYIHPHRSRRAAEHENALVKITECDLLMPVARTYQAGDRTQGRRWGGIGFKVCSFMLGCRPTGQLASFDDSELNKENRTRETLNKSGQNIIGITQGGDRFAVVDANSGVLRYANIETTANDSIPGDFSICSSRPMTAHLLGSTLDSTWDNVDSPSHSRMEFAQYTQTPGKGRAGETPLAASLPNKSVVHYSDSDARAKLQSTGTESMTCSVTASDVSGESPTARDPSRILRSRFAGATIPMPYARTTNHHTQDFLSTSAPAPPFASSIELQGALSALSFWKPSPDVNVRVSAPMRRKRRRKRESAKKDVRTEVKVMSYDEGSANNSEETKPDEEKFIDKEAVSVNVPGKGGSSKAEKVMLSQRKVLHQVSIN